MKFDIIHKMNIWEKLEKGFLVLAPMEGVTDATFRQVINRAGRPDLFFTEFTNVSSYASEKGRANALERLKVVDGDKPIIAQIWGKNPEHFKEAAGALKGLGFDGVDLNMGCPDKNVNKTGGGAAMIKTPELARECLMQAREATDLPVSIKTRLGFYKVEEYKDWLSFLFSLNLPALTVHLRTRKEMSKVSAHFELIEEIVKMRDEIAPKTKLIINGDILDFEMAKKLQVEHPGVDGWMIGRGVFSNPFCFNADLENFSEGERIKRLFDLLNYHLELFEKEESGRSFEELKKFFKVYVNSFSGAAEIRAKLMVTKNVDEAKKVILEMC